MNRGGVFLDRDGTINHEVDFLRSPDQLRLLDGSAGAIRELNEGGWRVFVITNQSGIARGLLTECQLADVHTKLLAELKSHGASVDAIYYCPHHPDYGEPPYRLDCDCRKPKPGMLMRAAKEFQIDLNQSFVVGDRMLDIQAGNAAGARSVLVLTGYGNEELKLCRENGVPIDHIARNLAEAVRHIQQTSVITR
jgi:D-glycero-D-manno-heptose 1,7-bisphosphate phosphatase